MNQLWVYDDACFYQLYEFSDVAGGNIAAAWAAIKALGTEGYMEKAKTLMDTTTTMTSRIREITVNQCHSLL